MTSVELSENPITTPATASAPRVRAPGARRVLLTSPADRPERLDHAVRVEELSDRPLHLVGTLEHEQVRRSRHDGELGLREGLEQRGGVREEDGVVVGSEHEHRVADAAEVLHGERWLRLEHGQGLVDDHREVLGPIG